MKYLLLTCFSGFGLAALSAAQSSTGGIKAGFAERDITPQIGMGESHAVKRVFFKSFHDPCKVRVAVFDDGSKKVALIGLDALMVPRAVVLQARAEIEKNCGIKSDAVMIGASHSHSSGPVGIVMPGQFDAAPADVRRLAYEESSQADAAYLRRLIHEMVEGVRIADANRVPAKLGFGHGHEDKVSFNRRFRMKNGQSWTNPGAMNPDIVDYADPIDPQVGVVGAWDLAGNLLGAVVNFACHAGTNPGGISANWPGEMEKTIQAALNSRAPVLFLAGASGDVGQIDYLSPYPRRPNDDWMRFIGGRVGAEAVKVLLIMVRGSNVPLETRQKIWKIKRRVPARERVVQAREIAAKILAAGTQGRDPAAWFFARDTVMLDYIISLEPEVEVEVQAIQVGPAIYVSNPAEYFVQYGLEIKRGSPFPFTFPVSLANGCVGYVPTEEAFSPSGGGYETRLTFYSNLDSTAGRQFADAGIAFAKEMTPGPIPEPPKLRGPGDPWPFGNVAPQLK